VHIVLTDLLTCPRCGPDFGLILLAERMEGRKVIEGRLGCANCREEYPVHNGEPDLRLVPPATAWTPASGDAERALRFAALLGVGHAPGTVLVYGADAGLLGGIRDLLPNARVLGAGPGALPGVGAEGVDWAVVGDRVPLRSGSLRGLAFALPPGEALLDEALRVLAPGAHLVVDPAPPGLAASLVPKGVEILLEQDGATVASYPARR
jgi:uncharacterized protein YbaR (Trm112 family)